MASPPASRRAPISRNSGQPRSSTSPEIQKPMDLFAAKPFAEVDQAKTRGVAASTCACAKPPREPRFPTVPKVHGLPRPTVTTRTVAAAQDATAQRRRGERVDWYVRARAMARKHRKPEDRLQDPFMSPNGDRNETGRPDRAAGQGIPRRDRCLRTMIRSRNGAGRADRNGERPAARVERPAPAGPGAGRPGAELDRALRRPGCDRGRGDYGSEDRCAA